MTSTSCRSSRTSHEAPEGHAEGVGPTGPAPFTGDLGLHGSTLRGCSQRDHTRYHPSFFSLTRPCTNMVCYQDANGNATAQRNARSKHYVVFDQPSDQGLRLKTAYPNLGWAIDTEQGHAALPFSVAARLLLPPYVPDAASLEDPLFGEFPTGQLWDRIWTNVVGQIDFSSDNIFRAVMDAAHGAPDQIVFHEVPGDWAPVQGEITGDGLSRWLPDVTRGDAFLDATEEAPGLAAALIFYYMGPYMVTALRGASSHFTIAGNTMCKLFQSDEDEEVCDGRQLAADVCAGIRDCVWCDTFLTVVPGPDDTATLNARGGARLADLRNAQAYYAERLSNSGHATQYTTVPILLRAGPMIRAKSLHTPTSHQRMFHTKLSVTTARCRNDKHFMSELQNIARSSRRSRGRRRTHRTRAVHR